MWKVLQVQQKSNLNHVQVDVERSRHDAGILVAQGFTKLVVYVLNLIWCY